MSFSKGEILQILDENSNEKLKERIAGKIPIENEIAKKFISSGIELAFENINLTSSKFALGLIMTNERVLDKIPVLFLEEFKNKNIQIYPDKILFKMIRILPIKKIVEKVQDN